MRMPGCTRGEIGEDWVREGEVFEPTPGGMVMEEELEVEERRSAGMGVEVNSG